MVTRHLFEFIHNKTVMARLLLKNDQTIPEVCKDLRKFLTTVHRQNPNIITNASDLAAKYLIWSAEFARQADKVLYAKARSQKFDFSGVEIIIDRPQGVSCIYQIDCDHLLTKLPEIRALLPEGAAIIVQSKEAEQALATLQIS